METRLPTILDGIWTAVLMPREAARSREPPNPRVEPDGGQLLWQNPSVQPPRLTRIALGPMTYSFPGGIH